MNYLEALFLGVIQGLTEFLPISSSAHVQIAESFFENQVSTSELTAFIATIQLGTELAVLIFFWKDIVRIVSAWFRSGFKKEMTTDAKLGWLVIVGSLPVVVVGLLFKDLIENELRNLWIVAFTLIGFGLILGLADRVGLKKREIESLTFGQGLIYGLGQMLAVIPGVSRSGGTITAGLLMGFTRAAAARYSFLLAIPAVLASGLFEFATNVKNLAMDSILATILATAISFIVGIFVIKYLLQYLNKGSFAPFVIWRLLVGILLLVLLNTGLLQP